MASDRQTAKESVVPGSTETTEPAELKVLFSSAQEQQHRLNQEKNRAREKMRELDIAEKQLTLSGQQADRGIIGQLVESKENAPTAIAVVSGIVIAIYCYRCAVYSANTQTWMQAAYNAVAFALAALSFIFGRAGKT